MRLIERLRESRCDIVERWAQEAWDPRSHPVGTTISAEIGLLFDALLLAAPPEDLAPHLDRILEIKCVQDGPYSAAVSFVFRLKDVIRDEIASGPRGLRLLEEFLEFGDRIDRLGLMAFESHSRIQRRIADLRVREAKARVAGLLRMTKVNWNELPSCAPPPEEDSGDQGR